MGEKKIDAKLEAGEIKIDKKARDEFFAERDEQKRRQESISVAS